MISKRLKKISSLLDSNDIVLDIGTDHALLPIYLIKNNIVQVADGSDISENVLKTAIRNVEKNKLNSKINLYLSDGVKNIDTSKYNTFVITGMGFNTIKGILSNADLSSVNKMIIQTNNDYAEFRKFIQSINYAINAEHCIKDKKINYIIFNISSGKQKLTNSEVLCGIYSPDNKWYYQECIDKLTSIIKKSPDDNVDKVKEIQNIVDLYTDYLAR